MIELVRNLSQGTSEIFLSCTGGHLNTEFRFINGHRYP